MSPRSGCSAPGGGGGGLHKQMVNGMARANSQKQLMTNLKLDKHDYMAILLVFQCLKAV